MSLKRSALRHAWIESDHPVSRFLARPIRAFIRTEASGGTVLLAAALLALVWANSPWSGSYETLWETHIGISIGTFHVEETLRDWVNDGLMAVFFFVVGLEIKRELVVGELNEIRKAALPAIAALGGMLVPAVLYAAFNTGGDGSAGWGIPMATDIAFAVGVLALLGRRCPSSLKVFLLSLAIVDDIGAIVVIAIFYTPSISFGWLAAAVVMLGAGLVIRRTWFFWMPLFVLLGVGVWFATFESGVHATIAGVALGLLAPMRPAKVPAYLVERAPEAAASHAEGPSIAEQLLEALHPYSSYVIVPIFALANAGVKLTSESLNGAATSPVVIGIIVGLVVGKIVGITFMSWLAVKLRIGSLPTGVRMSHIFGVAGVAGIGFTVSLFIAGLAFDDALITDEAKIGILVGSLLATLVGGILLTLAGRRDPVLPNMRVSTED